jgi:hypothetical protein
MRSPWSIGLVMIVMAGMSVSGIDGVRPQGVAPWVIAGILCAGGIVMLLRPPWAMWVAVGCSAMLVVTGALAYLGHPGLALPVHPILSIVIGLYICLRSLLMRPTRPPSPRPTASAD